MNADWLNSGFFTLLGTRTAIYKVDRQHCLIPASFNGKAYTLSALQMPMGYCHKIMNAKLSQILCVSRHPVQSPIF